MSACSLARPSVSRMAPVLVQRGAARSCRTAPAGGSCTRTSAPVGELPARHRHEHALRALDDLQVPDDEGVVEGDRAEREQPLVVLLAQLDADFRDDHRGSPSGGIRGQRLRTTRTRDSGSSGRRGSRNAAATRTASSRSRHTANTADPLPDIRHPHGASAASRRTRIRSTSGRKGERRLLQPVEQAAAEGVRVAGPERAPQRVAVDAGDAGTREPPVHLGRAQARPAGTPARSRAAGRRGSGRHHLARGRYTRRPAGVRKNATSDPIAAPRQRRVRRVSGQFPDSVQGRRARRPRRSTRRRARPASGCAS